MTMLTISIKVERIAGWVKPSRTMCIPRPKSTANKRTVGTINQALDADKIGPYVDELAERISQFPAESITACKRAVYASIDLPIEEALKEEAYWLYQSMSKTPAQKRFQYADDNGAQNDLDNQRNWEQLVMGIQEVK